jgi:hypothetical protein
VQGWKENIKEKQGKVRAKEKGSGRVKKEADKRKGKEEEWKGRNAGSKKR